VKVSRWFWIAIVIWIFTGLPIMIVAIGFAGPDLFTFQGVADLLTPDIRTISGLVSWAFGWSMILFPLLLLPFAIKKQ
jgi:hypothetical protein